MASQIEAFVRVTALVIATLIPIVNPSGGAPVFLSMTPGASDATRTTLSRRVAVDSFLLLGAAMLTGSHVLGFFGLSLAVVKIAGGLLVMASGWRLVNADASTAASPAETASGWGIEEIASRAFYPLTFPLTIGPGSLSVAVTVGAGARETGVPMFGRMMGAFAGIAVVALAIYLSYRFAGRVIRKLGTTGTVVLLRLSAFILLAVGVEILSDGLVQRFSVLSSHL